MGIRSSPSDGRRVFLSAGDTRSRGAASATNQAVPSTYPVRLGNIELRPARWVAAMLTLILTGLLRGIWAQHALVLENLALRHQLAVL